MKAREMESLLVNWSVKHSGHERRRAYIGLSAIGDCPAAAYDRFIRGQDHSVGEHLRDRLSFELEYALICRLREMGLYQAAEPISLHGGLVQGHLDGLIRSGPNVDVLEIKTVPRAEHIPGYDAKTGQFMGRESQLPRRIYWQVQAYMHYTRRLKKLDVSWAMVLYLARESGLVTVKPVRYLPVMGAKIDARVQVLVEAARQRIRPACTCGHCLDSGEVRIVAPGSGEGEHGGQES